MKKPNWEKVTVSIFETLEAAGFKVESVDNGGGNDYFDNIKEAAEAAAATDESHVYFRSKDDGLLYWTYLVYGNSIYETISDYSASDSDTGMRFDATIVRWSDDNEYPYKL